MRVICSDCSHGVPVGTLGRCPKCNGILRPDYSDEEVRQLIGIQPGRGIDRFRTMLPVKVTIPSLGEGDTPLLPSRRIGPALGLKRLYFKHEGLNPTGAFKDRAGAVVAALALEAGAAGIVSASSGNASSAISAYCAAAGLKCAILMEPGNPSAKLRQTLATGAKVLLVEGVFSRGPLALAEFLKEVAKRINYYLGFVWAPINSYIMEGIKTISYEIAARLSAAPNVVIAPVGGGDLFAAQWRGYKELQRAGLIDQLPRMVGVQSESAPPLLQAVRTGAKSVPTLPYARSKISGINVPFTGDHALQAVRESSGTAAGITDEATWDMQRRLAVEEGIWVEPAGAAPIAALPSLLAQKLIDPDEIVICVMSGAGYKDATFAAEQAQALGQQQAVPFDVDAVVERIL